MTFVLRFLCLYLLSCEDCGKHKVAIGHGNALSTCYHHDDHCPIQIAERLAKALPTGPAGAVLRSYPTASGTHVTITAAAPDVETDAPGWTATCEACGWTDDQYACWHQLWPLYPAIASGDVRGLLLDNAEEHAHTCDTLASYVTAAGARVRIVRKEIEGWSPIPTIDGPAFSITTDCEVCGHLREEHASVVGGYESRLVERAHDEARVHAEMCDRLPGRPLPESGVAR